MTASETLADALAARSVTVTPPQQQLLQQYCDQLRLWNSRLNLTRHSDYDSFVTRDLHDSLHLLAHLSPGESILDIGSGGGVPGIVMWILNHELQLSLCESTQKKANALQSIVRELDLEIPVRADRAEKVIAAQPVDTITARAVAPLRKLLFWFRPQRTQFGRMLLIKGPAWQQEREVAEEEGLMRRVQLKVLEEYSTPGHDGLSVILEVRIT